VVDSTASVGVVGASATVAAGDPFRVSFLKNLGDEVVADFDLIVKEGGVVTWTDEVKRLVHAPKLGVVTLRIDDTATGDGDGVVDAGESFLLYYTMKNFGTGAATAHAAIVTDLDNGFTFSDSTDAFAAIPSLGSEENTTGFAMVEPSVAGEHRLELVAVDLYGRTYRDTLELRPPLPPTNLSIDPRLGPDRLQVSWDESPSADVTHYNIYHSLTPGGPYTIANSDPVAHAVFVDVGLAASTVYYYVATAIDSSGNESAKSAQFSGSTNPANAEGWPITMELVTTSSPVVGDVDGDGDLEVVVGDDKVYAWHHDGVELVDGDDEPQTWGVLSTAGYQFVSPIALARLDSVPGLDIIAASRDSMKVYAFRYDGSQVVGWPRPVEHTIRAGIAVGDLNNDNVLEVVAVDEKGVVYAWSANGAEWIDGDSNPATPGVFRRLPGCVFHYSTPALADMDGDGDDEIVLGTEADSLYVFDGDGSLLPGWPYWLQADVSGSVAVGDIDDDGDLEVVANTLGGGVYALHHDGSILWGQWIQNGKSFGPSPALADVSGDGKLETFLPSKNHYLYAFTSTGGFLSGWPVVYAPTTDTESSPIVVDMDGDGALDVVLGDETEFLHAWDASGSPIAGFPLATTDAMRAVPAAADLDGDGDIELVAAGWDKTVYVWDFQSLYTTSDRNWPQFHGNSHNNGRIGTVIPTGVEDVAFAFSVVGETVELSWVMPARSGYLFDVYRASAAEARAGHFYLLASARGVDGEGRLVYVDRAVEAGSRYVYRIEESGGKGYETPEVYVPVVRAELGQNYPNPFNRGRTTRTRSTR